MTDFTKKWLTIAAGVALSGGLVLMIYNQTIAPKVSDSLIDKEVGESNQLVVTTPEGETGGNSSEKEEVSLTIPPITSESGGNVTEEPEIHPDPNISIPEAGTMNGNDQGTEQTIQPDVPQKPTYSEEQLADPTQTPSGGAVTQTETGSIPVETPDSTTTTQPEPESEPEPIPPSTNQEGEGEGKYVDGFGWVPYSGPNEAIFAYDMYESGIKVGTM